MDYSLPGSSVHGILQARILEWVAISSSTGFSQPMFPASPALTCIFFTTVPPDVLGAALYPSRLDEDYNPIFPESPLCRKQIIGLLNFTIFEPISQQNFPSILCLYPIISVSLDNSNNSLFPSLRWWNSSVQFSLSVMSDSLRSHELQQARPPCPSPIPRVHPNPCPLSRRCHPTISSSVILFSCCPQFFLGSGSFQMNQLRQSWLAVPGGSDRKASVYNVGDLGSIPGSGRSPGEGNGNPLQYYYLENPMDRGAW